jgi:hypothetical protein
MKKVMILLALAGLLFSVSGCGLIPVDGDYDPVSHTAITGVKKNVHDLNLPKGFNHIILSNGWQNGEYQVAYYSSGIFLRYGAPGTITVTRNTITFSENDYQPTRQLAGTWYYEVDDEYDNVIEISRINADGEKEFVIFDY